MLRDHVGTGARLPRARRTCKPVLEVLERRWLLSVPTLQVGPAEPYQTINQALAAYSANAYSNAVILVDSGTYDESVDCTGDTLTLQPVGQVTIDGGLSLDPSDTLAVNLNGTTAGSGYDQLQVLGALSLNGAQLSPNVNFVPSAGNSFTIVAASTVNGTLGNVAADGVVAFSGTSFLGTYESAGVVLTAVPATPTVQVSDAGGSYNGSAYSATVSVAGVSGSFGSSLEGVTPSVAYYAGASATSTPLNGVPCAAGTYTVVASFPGSTDYGSASASASFTITKATPSVAVSEVGGFFDSLAYSASATVAGINGIFASSLEGVAPTLTYFAGSSAIGTGFGAAPADTGTYTVLACFAGSRDYASASAAITFTIGPAYYLAMPTITITDAGGTFNGSACPANATISGVGADDYASQILAGNALTLTYYTGTSATGTALAAAPSSAGAYTVVASYPGSADYLPASAATTFTIGKATPTVQVSDNGGVANGSTYSATATVAGVAGAAGGTLEGFGVSLAYYAGSSATGTPLEGAPSAAGAYTVVASFPGSTDYGSSAASTTFTISDVTPTVLVSDTGGVFDGLPYPAIASVGVQGSYGSSLEGVSPSLTYYVGTSATGTPLGTAPSSAGIYTALASFTGSADYLASSSSVTFTISRATPTVRVSDAGGIFNDFAFSASASVTGVMNNALSSLESVTPSLVYYAGSSASGTPLNTAPENVGTYTVVASFAGSNDYLPASSIATFTIAKAPATVQVSDFGGTFNGSPFSATAAVAGVNGSFGSALENVPLGLTYYSGSSASGTALAGAPASAGTYTVVATFAGSTDYGSASSTASFTIGKAVPAVQVSDAGGTFNGSAFSATASVAGVNGSFNAAIEGINGSFNAAIEGISPGLTYYAGGSASGTPLGSAPTSAGTYTVVARFAGGGDYGSASSTASFTIAKATPTVQVSDAGGAFNGSAFAATATVAGTNGSSASALEGISPSLTYYAGSSATGTALAGAPSSAGTYTVVASYAGGTDYTGAASSASFTIARATPSVNVTDAGGTFNALAFAATASVAGVNGSFTASLENTAPGVTYYAGSGTSGPALAGAPASAGTYTAVAAFAGSTDYASATSSVTFTIGKAAALVNVSDAGGTFNGSAFAVTASVAGVSGSFSASLEGTGLSVTYYLGSASGTLLNTAPTRAGTYTVVATFAGSMDYASATSSATFTINRAVATVQVSDTGGAYNGTAFGATALVAGIGASWSSSLEQVAPSLAYYEGSVSGTSLGGAPTSAGTYAVVATFAGSADYASASSTATFTIAKAVPSMQASDAGGTFSGAAFSATATVAGVGGVAGLALEGVSPTFSYFGGASASGTPLGAAPTGVGTWTALATFAGSSDYASASASVTFSILADVPTVQVHDAGGTYTGSAFAATPTVAGVSGSPSSSLEGVSATLTYFPGSIASGTSLGSAPTAVGTYTVLASFAGSSDYAAASSSATFVISKATPSLNLSDAGGVFNGSEFAATPTIAGAGDSFGSSLEGVTPSVAYYSGSNTSGTPLTSVPVSAGSYTAVASFAGSDDYASASVSIAFTISAPGTRTTPTVKVTDAGGTFNGSAFSASATVAGANGQAGESLEGVTPSLAYFAGSSAAGSALSAVPVHPGTYTVVATFAGSTDYAGASSSATFVISKAAPTLQISASGGTYNGSAFSATAQAAGVNGVSAASLEGVSPTLEYFARASAGGKSLAAAPTSAGTYTVVASFAGSQDYASASASAGFVIGKANPTVAVSDSGGTFTGKSYPGKATVAGLSGQAAASLEGVTPTLTYYSGYPASGSGSTTAPTSAGTYTVVASFAGSTDYAGASSSASFAITQATPKLEVADTGGTYDGLAFPAITSVAGVSGSFTSSLEGQAPTLTYYTGSIPNGSGTSVAPSTAGVYSVVASFAGSADYAGASVWTDFTIAKAVPALQVIDYSNTATGLPFVASVLVAGVSAVAGSSLEGVTPTVQYYAGTSRLPAAPSAAGTYTATATFAGSVDYTSAVSSATFAIEPAVPANVTLVAGNLQSSREYFTTPLEVLVTDQFNNPIANVQVTFSTVQGPTSATGLFRVPLASIGLSNSYVLTGTTTVLTNAKGLAVAPQLATNGYEGTFYVVATVQSVGEVYSFTFTEDSL